MPSVHGSHAHKNIQIAFHDDYRLHVQSSLQPIAATIAAIVAMTIVISITYNPCGYYENLSQLQPEITLLYSCTNAVANRRRSRLVVIGLFTTLGIQL